MFFKDIRGRKNIRVWPGPNGTRKNVRAELEKLYDREDAGEDVFTDPEFNDSYNPT